MSQHLSKKCLIREVYEILADGDLEVLTRKTIKKMLEERHGICLNDRKDDIKEAVESYLNVMDAMSNSQKNKSSQQGTQEDENNSNTKADGSQEQNEEIEKLFDSNSESSGEEEEKKINSDKAEEEKGNVHGYVADELFAQIVGNEVQYRYRMRKKLWKYIYDHNLLDGSVVHCDDLLKKLYPEDTIPAKPFLNMKVIWQTHSTESDSKPEKAQRMSKMKNYKISPELKEIVNADRLTRSEILKRFWEYVHSHHLQNEEKKRNIKPDEKLQKMFGKEEFDYRRVLAVIKDYMIDDGEVVEKEYVKKDSKKKEEKKERKERKKLEKSEKPEKEKKPNGYTKELPVDRVLSEFVGSPTCSRTNYMKVVWKYIKEHNLQNPENKREIVCDAKLRGVFNVDRINMVHIPKTFADHMLPQ